MVTNRHENFNHTAKTWTISLQSGGMADYLNCAFSPLRNVNGIVWLDESAVGVRGGSEPGIDGISVSLYRSVDGVYEPTGETRITSTGGMFSFNNLMPGEYRVGLTNEGPTKADDYLRTNPDVNKNQTRESRYLDFGFGLDLIREIEIGLALPVTITGHAFIDRDGNSAGIFRPNIDEVMPVPIKVTIERVLGGTVLYSYNIDTEEGRFSSDSLSERLLPGNYVVHFAQVGGLESPKSTTPPNPPIANYHGIGFTFDNIGAGQTRHVVVRYDRVWPNISGRIWWDNNADGQYGTNPGDFPLGNREIVLYRRTNPFVEVARIITNADGTYLFTLIEEPGEYSIKLASPYTVGAESFFTGYAGVLPPGSNFDGDTGIWTFPVYDADIVNANSGYHSPFDVDGTVKLGDEPIAGGTVELERWDSASNQYVPWRSVTTDANGGYEFLRLLPVRYRMAVHIPENTSYAGNVGSQQANIVYIGLDLTNPSSVVGQDRTAVVETVVVPQSSGNQGGGQGNSWQFVPQIPPRQPSAEPAQALGMTVHMALAAGQPFVVGPGSEVRYVVTVTNTGRETLRDVLATIDIFGVTYEVGVIAQLESGQSIDLLFDYVVAQNVTPGMIITAVPRAAESRIDATEMPVDVAVSMFIAEHNWYLRGYPDNTMRPDGTITRAEVSMALYRMLAPSVRDANTFRAEMYVDVDYDSWYGLAIICLANLGVLKGYEDSSFRPNEPITRAEMATVLSRFYALSATESSPFVDVDSGHWAWLYILSAYANGWLIGNPDGTFRPDNETTRAEFATMVNRMLNRKVRLEDILPEVHRFDDLTPVHWGYAALTEAANSHTYERHHELDYETWIKLVGDGINAEYNR
jgi:hypothetical protein